jgi:hypothetical protein
MLLFISPYTMDTCVGWSFTPNLCRILFNYLKLLTQFTAVATALTLSSLSASTVPQVPSVAMEIEEEKVVVEAVEVVVETETRWVLPTASHTEAKVLNALQERGIEDRNAIATVMGNIKQESKFNANICEGGARVSYWGCRSGGYGLIQWTTSDRYSGLGRHAYRIGLDPSTTDAQVSFLFTERQWKRIEPSLKTSGQSIGFYMGKAYYWLGWGIHGNRTTYAYQYASRLTSIEVPVT